MKERAFVGLVMIVAGALLFLIGGNAWTVGLCGLLHLIGIFRHVAHRPVPQTSQTKSLRWQIFVIGLAATIGPCVIFMITNPDGRLFPSALPDISLLFAEFVLCASAIVFLVRRNCRPATHAGLFVMMTPALMTHSQIPAYGPLSLVFLCGTLLVIAVFLSSLQAKNRSGALRRLVETGVLVGIFPAMLLFSAAWSFSLENINILFSRWAAMRSATPARVYPQSGMLNNIVSEQSTNPDNVALRVTSESAPGYLRGRAFDVFYRGRWWASAASRRISRGREFQMLIPTVNLNALEFLADTQEELNGFRIRPFRNNSRLSIFRVQNDPRRGDTFFTPFGCQVVFAPARILQIDPDGIIRSGLDPQAAYYVCTDNSAWEHELTEQDRALLLTPLDDVGTAADAVVEQIDVRPETAARVRMSSVERYFHDNYEYTVASEPFPVAPVNRLAWFLTKRPAAHCEFFASAAVAVLRKMGFPARYVTGYVVDEFDDEGDTWIARNRHAHAWAEAYDETTGTWHIVEATPGRDRPTTPESNGTNERYAAAGNSAANNFDSESDAVLPGVTAILQFFNPSYNLTTLSLVGVLLFLIGLTIYARWISRKQEFPFLRELRRLDVRIAKAGFSRERNETLHQFAARLRDSTVLSAGEECAEVYATYAQLRFGGAGPDDWARWQEMLRQTIRSVPKRSRMNTSSS